MSPSLVLAQPSKRAAWQEEWEKTLALARQEGRLVCACPPHAGTRPAVEAFKQEFPWIKLEYNAIHIRDLGPRVQAERLGGQYLWDLYVGGPSQEVYAFKDSGFLEPLHPMLILPEVREERVWNGGFESAFHDSAHRFVFAYSQNADSFDVNRDLISESELKTWRDLFDPKYKGKMIWLDPLRGGGGSNRLAMAYFLLGEDGVRRLLVEQKAAVAANDRQATEWMVRGLYAISFGAASRSTLAPFLAQGLGLNIRPVGNSPEVAYEAAAGGGVNVFNRAPNPNATKVFINWLLSRNTQISIAKASGSNSRRVDVASVDPDRIAIKGQQYKVIGQSEEFIKKYRLPAVQLAKKYLR
jgi:iron(III) transport system substrate-binding protein